MLRVSIGKWWSRLRMRTTRNAMNVRSQVSRTSPKGPRVEERKRRVHQRTVINKGNMRFGGSHIGNPTVRSRLQRPLISLARAHQKHARLALRSQIGDAAHERPGRPGRVRPKLCVQLRHHLRIRTPRLPSTFPPTAQHTVAGPNAMFRHPPVHLPNCEPTLML